MWRIQFSLEGRNKCLSPVFPWEPTLNATVVALKMLLWKQLAIRENRLKILISREIPLWMRNARGVDSLQIRNVFLFYVRKLYSVHDRMRIRWM